MAVRDYCFGQWHDVCIDTVNKLQDTTDNMLQMETQLKHMNNSVQALVQLQNRVETRVWVSFGGT